MFCYNIRKVTYQVQRNWKTSLVVQDQSAHLDYMYIKGVHNELGTSVEAKSLRGHLGWLKILTKLGQFQCKFPLLISWWHTNALCLNCNNFQTVMATNILFSALHTTPFFYGKLYFRLLHMHSDDDTRSNTPWGSKPPYLPPSGRSFQITSNLVCT